MGVAVREWRQISSWGVTLFRWVLVLSFISLKFSFVGHSELIRSRETD